MLLVDLLLVALFLDGASIGGPSENQMAPDVLSDLLANGPPTA